jgi:PhnB protein
MQVVPYLNFRNQCREAFAAYAALLGGGIDFIQTFGETPMAADQPTEWKEAVMHASLRYPGGQRMGADPPGDKFKPAQGHWISLQVDTPEEAERVWAELARAGTVAMPLDETFWAKRFGMVTDRFGTPWMVNCA